VGAIRERRFLRKKGLIPDPLGEGKNPKRKKNHPCRQTGKIPGTDRNSSSRRPTSIRYVYTCLKGCDNPPSFYGNLILCSFRLAFEIINSSSDNTIHGFSFFNDTDDIPSSRDMVSREHWAAAGVEATWILRGVIAWHHLWRLKGFWRRAWFRNGLDLAAKDAQLVLEWHFFRVLSQFVLTWQVKK